MTGKVEGTVWEKREGSFHTPQTQDREGRGDSLGEERGIIPHTRLVTGKVEGTAWEKREGSFHTPDSGQGR